jgi:anhydro-N-acetylmuramic acid kinase
VQAVRALGLMSGTSLDGVDAAVVETDGDRIFAFGPTSYRAYGDDERAVLRQALTEAVSLTDRTSRPGAIAEAEPLITRTHVETAERLLSENGIARGDIAVVGFHGQTVIHRPQHKLTVQIGDGPALAKCLGLPVVHDFRQADVAAGGQGAPLVPVFHRAIAGTLDRPQPVAMLNIGGVANVTFIDGEQAPIACDTGPGNALIDDFMRARTGASYDTDGDAAAAGVPDRSFITQVLGHPFFDQPPPKSLDRNAFAFARIGLPDYSVTDGAATLSALTVEAIARVLPHLPKKPRTWIVAGGGARNRTLMRMLAARVAPASVESADQAGFSADAIEAQAFAFLAVRSMRGLPITFPTTTGAPRPMTGGVMARP